MQTKLNLPLCKTDPVLFDIIEQEKKRQQQSLCLIPSENFTSRAVLDALGSVMQNKYSEGYPSARYYGGNEYIDMVESLCQKRALSCYRVSSDNWGVNVQPHSGSPANFQVFSGLLDPKDCILGLDLSHGGHLSHGFKLPHKSVSMVSRYFKTVSYKLNNTTDLIDYDALEELAIECKPKMIIAGTSAYSRHIDYARIRNICDRVGSYMLADMAHISGLVAAGVVPSPFEFADIVTTTTHKSLRGPRGAMIFYRKGNRTSTGESFNFETRINQSVFPGHQGGPHNHTIAALSTALLQAKSTDFKTYQIQVLDNSKAMAQSMIELGYTLMSGGTDNHMMLIDLKSKEIDGARVEAVCSAANIALNKNTIPGDTSAFIPSGLRIGTPALTTRGFQATDFNTVANLLDRAVHIAKDTRASSGPKLGDFKNNLKIGIRAVEELKSDVASFSASFPVVGFDASSMKYKNSVDVGAVESEAVK